MDKMIKNIYKQAKLLNAKESHYASEGILGDENATAVVSVYIDQRPSHEILNDLVTWAEETNQQALLDKIEALATLDKHKAIQ